MSLRLDAYTFPDSATPAAAYLWPENIMFGSSDQSGRVTLWAHRAAADALAAVTPGSGVRPADVVVLDADPPGTPPEHCRFCTITELFTKAGEDAAAQQLPPHLAITEALYFYLALRRFPGGVRVTDA